MKYQAKTNEIIRQVKDEDSQETREVNLNKNWRLRLVTSMRSISMTSRFRKPVRAKSFNNSQPKPPAPTTNTLAKA